MLASVRGMIFAIVGVYLMVELTQAVKVVTIFQPSARCQSICEMDGCAARRRELADGANDWARSLGSCTGVPNEQNLPCSCGLPNPQATAENLWIPVDGFVTPDTCVNSTYMSGGRPTSFKISCNGTTFIDAVEFHNNTANCSSMGDQRYNVLVGTRNGVVDISKAPGGLNGPFGNIVNNQYGFKCVDVSRAVITSEFNDLACTEKQANPTTGEQQVHLYVSDSCVQAYDTNVVANTRWRRWSILNSTHVAEYLYGNVSDSIEDGLTACNGYVENTKIYQVDVCNQGRKVSIFSGVATHSLSAAVALLSFIFTFRN